MFTFRFVNHDDDAERSVPTLFDIASQSSNHELLHRGYSRRCAKNSAGRSVEQRRRGTIASFAVDDEEKEEESTNDLHRQADLRIGEEIRR